MYEMIVIGGGPAALAAAFFAQGKRVRVVTIFDELGGKVGWRQTLVGPDHDSYLPGNELVPLLAQRTVNRANAVINDRVTRISQRGDMFEVATPNHGVLQAPIVIVATGSSPIQLTASGAERLLDNGLEHSAATYAHLTSRKSVAVIGGTVRALSSAVELARVAKQVYVLAPSFAPQGKDITTLLGIHPAVEMVHGAEVTEVIGDDHLTGLAIMQDGVRRVIDVDYAFVSLGVTPNSGIVRELVDIDDNGFIQVDDYYESSVPGLFAAGDVTTKFAEHVLAAIGDGARASMHAYQRLLARWLAAGTNQAQPR